MEIPKIPHTLEEWDIEKLDELIQYVGIESDTLDFKKEANKLEEHICAMANTKGGYIVLGINQIKSKDGKKIIRFEKKGFTHGKEDNIKNDITNHVLLLEPVPNMGIDHIHERNGKKFYTILKIENNNSSKPYFVTSTDQCFVRIQASKTRASRSVIFNLFSTNIEQRKNLESLRSACGLVKESTLHIIRDIHNASPTSTMKIPILDLTYLRSSVISCEWFLKENNLWGEHTGQGSYTHGINSLLHELELMNIYVKAYDDSHDTSERHSLKKQLSSYGHGSPFEEDVTKDFDKIITTINEFLENQK